MLKSYRGHNVARNPLMKPADPSMSPQIHEAARPVTELASKRSGASTFSSGKEFDYHLRLMAKHSLQILELAKKGAIHRYQELKAEIASLMKAFPHLRYRSAVSPAIDLSSEPAATIDRKPRKRGKLSAAGRRAIAAAQRARWAKIKAKKSGPTKRKGMSAAARKAVSLRMKKYWAERRKQKGK
jgi:hypothetical protein